MIDLVPEFEAREMYEDYLAEMKELGEEPVDFRTWCADEQIEPV